MDRQDKPETKFDPEASAARKKMPLFDGFLMYFPDAALAVSAFSFSANEKHNPGEPLHWSKHKSSDHANCVARHLTDIGPNWDAIDPEFGVMHAVPLAWRALAVLQIAIEAKRAGLSVREYLAKLKAEAEAKQPGRDPFAADDDGWREWTGGLNSPVTGPTRVRFRSGYEINSDHPGQFYWYHKGGQGDIVAYKVLS